MRWNALSSLWNTSELYKQWKEGKFSFPRRCWVCSATAETPADLCQACQADLPHREPPLLRRSITGVDRGYAALHYTFPVTRLVKAAKFDRDLAALHVLRTLFVEAFTRLLDGQKMGLLVPVPLHALRFIGRGFNQAGELSAALGRCTRIRVEHGVLRRRRVWATPQSTLDARARQRNIASSFLAERRKPFGGQTVVLVDDVVTTGATAGSAALALRERGANEIILLCLAATPALGRTST